MIVIQLAQYEEFMSTNDKPIYGSFFDGEKYTFYETPDEAALLQPKVQILPEPEVSQTQAIVDSLDAQQIEELLLKIKEKYS